MIKHISANFMLKACLLILISKFIVHAHLEFLLISIESLPEGLNLRSVLQMLLIYLCFFCFIHVSGLSHQTDILITTCYRKSCLISY